MHNDLQKDASTQRQKAKHLIDDNAISLMFKISGMPV